MSELNSTNQRGYRIDLTGKRFGNLVVLRYAGTSLCRWECACDCGNITSVIGQGLREGISKSCGCMAFAWEPIFYPCDVVGVPLTQGKVALIDAADLTLVRDHKWMAHQHRRTFYARAKSGRLKMHKLLMPEVALVDHKNGDGLDNRRENLRSCTFQENAWNARRDIGVSGFRGVSWHRRRGKWVARITVDGKRVTLGCSASEIDAAKIYDQECKRLRGEFAVLNFPNFV